MTTEVGDYFGASLFWVGFLLGASASFSSPIALRLALIVGGAIRGTNYDLLRRFSVFVSIGRTLWRSWILADLTLASSMAIRWACGVEFGVPPRIP